MTIWTTSVEASTTSSLPVRKTRAVSMTYEAVSLLPKSNYTFWVNGIDMTWACRQEGRRMGAGLTSDAAGYLKIIFMAEINITPSSADNKSTFYHMMFLKDINGNVVGLTVSEQIGK
jgi:hypothetical protein